MDISDAPLLTLARKNPEVLTFVHSVKEEDDSSSPIDNVGGSSDISDEEDNWDCFDEDSGEEAEFEGQVFLHEVKKRLEKATSWKIICIRLDFLSFKYKF